MKSEICLYCNRDFIKKTHNKVYCSKECCGKYNYEKYNNEEIVKLKKRCKFCNKFFIAKTHNNFYCSDDCRYIGYNSYKMEFHKDKKCLNCNNPIPKYNKNFCSKKCYSDNFKKNRKVIKPYLKIRFEILKRDNFTCQYCGRNVKKDMIKLHVDHIHPNKKGGLFIAENLITSCEECNLGKSDILLEERKLNKSYER